MEGWQMERVLEHVDVEEMYLDVDSENLPDKGEIVETAHFFVGQAYNAHIHVVEKESGDMVMHINCTIMYSKERLQAFADLIEKDGGPSIEAVRAL